MRRLMTIRAAGEPLLQVSWAMPFSSTAVGEALAIRAGVHDAISNGFISRDSGFIEEFKAVIKSPFLERVELPMVLTNVATIGGGSMYLVDGVVNNGRDNLMERFRLDI
ncbi:hypothetical protein NE237_012025 [Protea cynaroides]|uniref:Uncharacterized protein n=1 Tax=Protea cynaroides TaxID=273540 RepID=A0A9Q0H096_9MAGN|nr:hypothetical protein NE237_012025 [Protea cynaroides]